MAGTQAQFDQGARVGNGLVLPAIVGLVAAQGFFGRGVPLAARRTTQVVLLDQRLLDLEGAVAVDFLLTAAIALPGFPALA